MTKKTNIFTTIDISRTLEWYCENFHRSFDFKKEFWRFENKTWVSCDEEIVFLIKLNELITKSLENVYFSKENKDFVLQSEKFLNLLKQKITKRIKELEGV